MLEFYEIWNWVYLFYKMFKFVAKYHHKNAYNNFMNNISVKYKIHADKPGTMYCPLQSTAF